MNEKLFIAVWGCRNIQPLAPPKLEVLMSNRKQHHYAPWNYLFYSNHKFNYTIRLHKFGRLNNAHICILTRVHTQYEEVENKNV